MPKNLLLLLIFACLLTACDLPRVPQGTPMPTVDEVATQVIVMLTQQPTATSTNTPPVATATTAPTDTPVPSTPTATTQPTEAATPTQSTGDPKTTLGEPSWQTSFEGSNPFGKINSDNTQIYAENGALVLTGVTANGWTGWSLTFSQEPKDFYLEAVYQTQDCGGSDQYGLMFRAPNTSAGYFYGVTCDGQYFLYAGDYTGEVTETMLINPTSSAAIQAGANQVNHLGVKAQGDTITLYVNATRIAEVTDTTFTDTGYFGSFVAAYQTPNFTTRMEDIRLWNLP